VTVTAIPPTPSAAPVDPIASASSAGASALNVSPPTLPTTPQALAQVAQAQAVSVATAAAATRQSALAPLLADLAQAIASPSTPAPVQAAISQVLAQQTPLDPPPSAADLQQATAASGLFLEAQLASGAAPAADLKSTLLVLQQVLTTWLSDASSEAASQTAQTPASTPAALQPPQTLALGAAAPQNPSSQQGASGEGSSNSASSNPTPQPPVTATTPSLTLSGAAATETAPTQAAVSGAAQQLPPSGPAVAQAAPTPASTNSAAPPTPATGDAAQAASNASQLISIPVPPSEALPVTPQATAEPAPPASLPAQTPNTAVPTAAPTPSLPTALQAQAAFADSASEPSFVGAGLLLAALASRPSVVDDSNPPPLTAYGDDADSPPAANVPPAPPFRNGPTNGQPPATASLAPNAAPALAARSLLTATTGALARQELHQIASLPTDAASVAQRPADTSPRWMFELPFATPQGSAVAQFEISRDGGRTSVSEAETTWRARFSIDLEPMGPVHAQVSVTGARAGVTLWAERPETAAQLRGAQAALSQGLEQAEFAPAVSVQQGVPPRPAPPVAGRFLDQAS
jgi:hypothetical protein